MKSTRPRFTALALAAVALSAAFASAFDRLGAECMKVMRAVRDFVASVPAKFKQPRLAIISSPVELVQACAHAMKLAKRERPSVRDRWRMCPSI